MARRLIIRHGDRLTRHDITDKAITIGRDPSCDLFFVDHKLSRRHARMEPGSDGVRLVDLGSRNGSWVNEQRVENCFLKSEDVVRLGGLSITFEEDQPASPRMEEATVLLSGSSSGPVDAGTVMLEAPSTPDRVRGGDGAPDATVLLPGTPPGELSVTSLDTSKPRPIDDTGTVVFQEPHVETEEESAEAPALPPPAPSEAPPPPVSPGAEEEAARAPAPEPTPEAVPATTPMEEPGPIPVPLPWSRTTTLAVLLGGLVLVAFLMGVAVHARPIVLLVAAPLVGAAAWGAFLVLKRMMP